MKRCPRKMDDGMLPSRRDGWGMAGSSMWPRCSDARNEPLNADWPSWTSCRTIRQRDECDGGAAGEKKMVETQPELVENLKSVLEVRTAGNPDNADVLWTDLSPRQLADAVTDMGTPVSPPVVRSWMEEQKLGRHKIEKVLAGGHSPDRDAQFLRIAELKAEYFAAGNPVFSLDTKAKEHLGQLFREGRVWTQQAFRAFDHDFPSWATGVIIPHGIYDPPSQSRPYQHRPEPRHEPIRLRQSPLVLEPYRPTMLPARQVHPLVLRLWRKQFGGSVSFQTGLATPRQRPGTGNPSGSLPQLLLEVQPD